MPRQLVRMAADATQRQKKVRAATLVPAALKALGLAQKRKNIFQAGLILELHMLLPGLLHAHAL